jgi:hypothetical protein
MTKINQVNVRTTISDKVSTAEARRTTSCEMIRPNTTMIFADNDQRSHHHNRQRWDGYNREIPLVEKG